MFFKKIYNFGDKLEDKVRSNLSHYPIIYAFIGGAGVVLFWRGIWHTVDYLMGVYFFVGENISSTSTDHLPWWDGPLSIVVGVVLLLLVGLFVSSFIGNEIIISGLKKERKVIEKTEEEINFEILENLEKNLAFKDMDMRLKRIEKMLMKKQD